MAESDRLCNIDCHQEIPLYRADDIPDNMRENNPFDMFCHFLRIIYSSVIMIDNFIIFEYFIILVKTSLILCVFGQSSS